MPNSYFLVTANERVTENSWSSLLVIPNFKELSLPQPGAAVIYVPISNCTDPSKCCRTNLSSAKCLLYHLVDAARAFKKNKKQKNL